MNAPSKLPKHGRIKPKRNVKPTVREIAYHLWLMETCPCFCGCGKPSTVVHHPLQRHPEQRWRRDHEYVVPLNGYCHFELHQKFGSEEAFKPDFADEAFALAAADFRDMGYAEGLL